MPGAPNTAASSNMVGCGAYRTTAAPPNPLNPMLSELNFESHHNTMQLSTTTTTTTATINPISLLPPKGSIRAASSAGSLFSMFWDGLFCFSGGDDHELFYDAVEDAVDMPGGGGDGVGVGGNHSRTAAASAVTTVQRVPRGGSCDPPFEPTECGQEVQHKEHNNLFPTLLDQQRQHQQQQLPATSSSSYYFTPHSSSNSLAADLTSHNQHLHHYNSPSMHNRNNMIQEQALRYSPPEASGSAHHAGYHPRPSQQHLPRSSKAALHVTSSIHGDGTVVSDHNNPFTRLRAPPAPPVSQLPYRFLRAGKGDVVEGRRRYQATLDWRKEHDIDGILLEPHAQFQLIKSHYPHYYHGRGYDGEPVFFEQPPKTNLSALKAAGVDLPGLVRHYTMVTEFQWQFIEPSDQARSITVLDLEGIRMMDFVGECVEYVRKCSHFTGQHYPERAGHVIVINIPRWFAMIWNVVKPMVDEVTLKKISIVRGKDEVFQALVEKIPVENIPPEYGGKSPYPLGASPEEEALRDLMAHNNALATGDFSCGGRAAKPPCKFCSWGPVRSY